METEDTNTKRRSARLLEKDSAKKVKKTEPDEIKPVTTPKSSRRKNTKDGNEESAISVGAGTNGGINGIDPNILLQSTESYSSATKISTTVTTTTTTAIADASVASSAVKTTVEETKEEFVVSHQNFVRQKSGIIEKDYIFDKKPLGEGAYGLVMKGTHIFTGQVRAIKMIERKKTTKEEQERLQNEVQILKQLDHPNIIKVYEFYEDKKFLYIVTELCSGGELFDKIEKEGGFKEKQAAQTVKQILRAVCYCHKNNIMHRDLKPENVLYDAKEDDATLKVIDFGTSIAFDPNKAQKSKLGTPYYIAPEVLNKNYNEKCDIWSLGVITYILLVGYPPFNGEGDEEILSKIRKGKFAYPKADWAKISQEAKNFIDKLLAYEPENRYSAEEALLDPWIANCENMMDLDNEVAKQALQNMKTFRTDSKLARATFVFFASYMATKEEKNELMKVFEALDKNGDGLLSREELLEGYSKLMDQQAAEEEVDRIMGTIDANKSGVIDYTEFVMATLNRSDVLSDERLKAVYSMLDKDGNGSLSLEELRDFFTADQSISDDVWKKVISEVDQNGDGEVSFEEFKDMMKKLI